jgi:hypothetical protein
MATVLLVNLPRQEAERPPAVIAGLAGICKHAQIDYDVIDINLQTIKTFNAESWRDLQDYFVFYKNDSPVIKRFRSFVNHILPKNNYEIIAVSLFTFETIRAAHLVLPIIRQCYPNAKIIVGGHGTCYEDFDNNSLPFYQVALDKNIIDHYIIGEGEQAFANYLADPKGWVNTTNQFVLDNLNEMPFACYDKIPPSNYLNHDAPGAYITGSRGCVRDCTFCDVKYLYKKYRFRSAKNLFEEILCQHLDHGVNIIDFTDNLINGNVTEFKNLNKLLVEAQVKYPSLKQLKYSGDFICRPATQFTENDFKLMKAAGCSSISIGIESFSEAVRYHMGKKFRNTDIDFHLYCCGKLGIQNVFLMQTGYPTETLEDHNINLEYLKRYQKYAQSRVIKMLRWGYTTSILEGSPLDASLRHSLPIEQEYEYVKPTYGDFNWININNPSLTFYERIRRRVELHFHTKQYDYCQPRIYDEFNVILGNMQSFQKSKKIMRIL